MLYSALLLQALQCTEPLLITHRLDACTEGLLVVGRKRAFVQHFNQLLQQSGAVRKFYKTLTQYPPSVGESYLGVIYATAICALTFSTHVSVVMFMHLHT